jgi:signal transduction histidine kinase
MAFFLKFAEMLSHSSYSNLKLARSIADGERLMRSLAESNEHLQQADRRKTEFLGVLSHELRNPLAPIRNSLYVLDRAAPGSDQSVRARSILNRQVEHLTRLVDDLLDITRISHGKIALSHARLDLRDVVAKTCDDNRSLCDERAVGLHVQAPSAPVWVDADANRISQVIGNLLQNAAKFTPHGGRVDVEVTSGEALAEINVRDTGIGMDADDLDRMFEPFAQADQGLARVNGGLGLGLALVRALVELHGGTVRATSPGHGQGATFSFTLPLSTR